MRKPLLLTALAASLVGASLAAIACSKSSSASNDSDVDAGADAGPWYAPTPSSWDQPVTRPASDTAAATARAACQYTRGMMPAATLGPSTPVDVDVPITNIVVLMQENRSFDSYLGHLNAYAGRTDIESADAGAFNPDKPGGGGSDAGGTTADGGASDDAGVHPWSHASHLCFADTDHSWKGAHTEWDNGANDGFYFQNNGRSDPSDGEGGSLPSGTLDGERAMWFYDQTDIPFHYSLYSTFAMSDHYFCSLLGPTWPNRMYLYGANSYGVTDNSFPDLSPYPFPVPGKEAVIFDELEERQVSWSLYTDGSPGAGVILGVQLINRYNNRDPHFAISDFLAAAAAGTLPQVSFVDAKLGAADGPGNDDEHPPSQIQIGEHFVWEIVNAVTTSPQWAHTALFIDYDENGGIFDHYPPPKACAPDTAKPILNDTDKGTPGGFDQYGFRVPFVVVSPYAKKAYVSHDVYDHTSITKFIEAKFKLPVISGRDANADPFTDLFDWQNPPFVTPPTFPEPQINQTEATYCNQTFQ